MEAIFACFGILFLIRSRLQVYKLKAMKSLRYFSIQIHLPTSVRVMNYESNVDTQTQQNLSIDVFNWNSGVYQIRFVNSEGKYMYGTFEIE